MNSVVCLPGRPPIWLHHHARHMAQRLSDHGRVMVVQLASRHQDERVPGELQPGGVIGSAPSGYPIWSGGGPALLGIRRRSARVVMVLWDQTNMTLAVLAAIVSRVRGERLILNVVGDLDGTPLRRAGVGILTWLADAVVERDPSEDNDVRTVLAVCGGDALTARTVLAAFNGLSTSAVSRWRLQIVIDPDVLGPIEHRHEELVQLLATPSTEISLDGASVVIAPHGAPWARLVDRAVDTGAAGILVGHPVAQRIAQRGNGVLLAAQEPAGVLVALELATGAKDDLSISVEDLRASGELVVGLAVASA